MTLAVTLTGVTHRYGSTLALDEVSLEVGSGVTALLGTNGAGKTTMLRIVTGVLAPTSGTVHLVEGGAARRSLRPRELSHHVGYLPQEVPSVLGMNAVGYLRYFAFLKGIPAREAGPEARRCLERVDLADRASTPTRALSGGMKRRLGLAAALLGDPSLLVLDEPTAGLDPEQRAGMRRVLRSVSAETTVLLSTHLAEDAADLATQVAVLAEGRLKFVGSLDEFVGGGAPPDGGAVEEAFLATIGSTERGR